MSQIETKEQGFSKKDIAMVVAGLAITIGGIAYFVQEEKALIGRCLKSGQIDVNRIKTPIYDPRIECRMLFGEDEKGQQRQFSGMRW